MARQFHAVSTERSQDHSIDYDRKSLRMKTISLFTLSCLFTCWEACEGAGEWRESLLRSEEKLRLRPDGKPRPASTLLLLPAVTQANFKIFSNIAIIAQIKHFKELKRAFQFNRICRVRQRSWMVYK